MVVQGVPLASLAPGDYKLAIAITDKTNNRCHYSDGILCRDSLERHRLAHKWSYSMRHLDLTYLVWRIRRIDRKL